MYSRRQELGSYGFRAFSRRDWHLADANLYARQAGWAPRLSDNTEEPVPFLFLCLLKDTVFGACSRARGHDVTLSDASGIQGLSA